MHFISALTRSPIPKHFGIGVIVLLWLYATLSSSTVYAGTWSGSNPDDGLSLAASWNEIATVGGTTTVSLVFNVPDGFYVYPKIVNTADDSLAYPLCEDGSNLQRAYSETLLWTAASAGTYSVYYSLTTTTRLPDCEDVTTQLGGDLVIAAYTPPTPTPTPDASGQQATPTPTHTPTPTYRYVGAEDANEVQISAAWDDIVVAGGATTITLYVTWPDDPNIHLRLENVSTGGAVLPYCSSISGQGVSGQSQTGDWNGSATAGTYRIYYALRTDYPTSAPACTTTYSPDIVIADGLTPAQPTGLTATASNNQVTLNWTDPGNTNITSYEYIQRRGTDSFSDWVTIPGSSATTTSHTFTGLDSGIRYTYSIRAVNNGRTSANSLVADATTPTTPIPTNTPTPDPSAPTPTPRYVSDVNSDGVYFTASWEDITLAGGSTTVTFTNYADSGTFRYWKLVNTVTGEDVYQRCDSTGQVGIGQQGLVDATLDVENITAGTYRIHYIFTRSSTAPSCATGLTSTISPVLSIAEGPTPTPTNTPTPSSSPLDISHSSLGAGTEQASWAPIPYSGGLTTVTFTIKSNANTGRSAISVWGISPLRQSGCAFGVGNATVSFTLQLTAGLYVIRTVHQGSASLNCLSAALNPDETSAGDDTKYQSHTLSLADGSGGAPSPNIPSISNMTFTKGELVNSASYPETVLPAANGGVAPYTYALSGTLPSGLTIIRDDDTNNLAIYGVPTDTGNFPMYYSATGNRGLGGTTTVSFSIDIVAYTSSANAPTSTPAPEISIDGFIEPNSRYIHRQGTMNQDRLTYLVSKGGWSNLAEAGFVSADPPHNDIYITERYFIACDGAFIWRKRTGNVNIYTYGDPSAGTPTPMPVSESTLYMGGGSYYSVPLDGLTTSEEQGIVLEVTLIDAGKGITALANIQGISLLLDTTDSDSYRIYWENDHENYREIVIPAAYTIGLYRTDDDPVYATISSTAGTLPNIINTYDDDSSGTWTLTNRAYTEEGIPTLWRLSSITVNSGSTANFYAYTIPQSPTPNSCTVTDDEQSFTIAPQSASVSSALLTFLFSPSETFKSGACESIVYILPNRPEACSTLIAPGEVAGFLESGEWAGFLSALGEAADTLGLPHGLIATIFWLASTISIVGLTFYTTRIPMLAMIMAIFLTIGFAWVTPMPMVVAWLVVAGTLVIALNFKNLLA